MIRVKSGGPANADPRHDSRPDVARRQTAAARDRSAAPAAPAAHGPPARRAREAPHRRPGRTGVRQDGASGVLPAGVRGGLALVLTRPLGPRSLRLLPL